jgi:hypothetical protein
MSHRAVLARSAISGIVWGGVGIATVLLLDAPSGSLPRIIWAYRGGLLIAPLIGVAIGLSSQIFRRAGFRGRAVLAVISLYVAGFLFVLAARETELLGGELRGTQFANLIAECWNMTVAGLTWSGFALVLAPLAYVNHLLVSRRIVMPGSDRAAG